MAAGAEVLIGVFFIFFFVCLFFLDAVAGAEVLIGVPMDDGRSRSVAGH